MPTVAVIDPALRVAELDCFNRMSRASPIPLTYHLPALFGLDSLDGSDPAGVIVLGSGASANDGLPWLTELRAWLRPHVDGGTPLLGLCFGHQLLATLLGGEVGFAFGDRSKAAGMRRVRLAADPLWGEACEGDLMVSHREAVQRPPPDARVVGTRDDLPVEALAYRDRPIWSFQSHPEATPAFATNNSVPFDEDRSRLAFGHRIVDRFLERVATGR